MYTYIRQTKLSNICGRSDYITNKTGKHKEEDIILVGGTVSDWKPYAHYEKEHQKSNEPNNQGRELIVALPNSWVNVLNRPLLNKRISALAEKLIGKATDYQYAVHWNAAHNNLHAHIIFSERTVLSQGRDSEVWDRDIYLTAEGKIARRKADRALDKDGNVKPPIHRKGEPKNLAFSVKDKKYKSKAWLDSIKTVVSREWTKPLIGDKKHTTNYLHTLHEGKSPISSEKAKEINSRIREVNGIVADLEKDGYKFGKDFKSQLVHICYHRSFTPRPGQNIRNIRELYVPDVPSKTDIAKLAVNYDHITARQAEFERKRQEREEKAAEKERALAWKEYQKQSKLRDAAIYCIEREIGQRTLNMIDWNGYNLDTQERLRERVSNAIVPLNKEYERILKRNKLNIDTVKGVLSYEYRDTLRRVIEKFRDAGQEIHWKTGKLVRNPYFDAEFDRHIINPFNNAKSLDIVTNAKKRKPRQQQTRSSELSRWREEISTQREKEKQAQLQDYDKEEEEIDYPSHSR